MDLDRIKRNVGKMVDQNAPETDIDQYIASEGVTLDEVRNHRTGMIDQSKPAAPAVQRPQLSAGETAADVAKSAGIGLAQGAIGMATLPGNVEQLGRMGINAASRAVGGNDLVSNDAALPTFSDAKGFIEGYTGKFYEPQSTAGEYARTIGEFAPAAAFGGGGVNALARAANVLAPAVVSETAGQVTKGTAAEPWARAAGALAGGIVPRSVSPLPVDPTRTAMVRQLEGEGITSLTAGQKTGKDALRWAESVAKDTPFAGSRAKAIETTQKEQFTRAALKRVGVTADRATPEVIDKAFHDIGAKFDSLANTSRMAFDRQLTRDLQGAINDYNQVVPPSMRAPVIDNIMQDIASMAQQNGGMLPGQAYQAVRSRIDRMRRGSLADPQLSGALGDIREALDNAMQRSMPAPRAQSWQKVRGEYKNLLTIEKAMGGAGEDTAVGLLSASQLRAAARQQNKRAYARGTDDLGPLARAGEAIMKPLPQSGTAPRQAAQNVLSGMGALAGGSVANVPGAVIGAMAPMALQGVLARGLMSRPMQNYLSNQLAAGYMAGRPPISTNALLVPQIADEYPGLQGRQTLGPGSTYDPYQ